jgi:hypothetical protein
MGDHQAPLQEEGAPSAPNCDACRKPIVFVATIPRVTEPGRVRLFQCTDCEKVGFRPER